MIKLKNILNESLSIGLSIENIFELIEWQDNYKDLFPSYSEDEFINEYSEEYMYETKEQAYEEINFIIDRFESLPNPIPIYRTIQVESLENFNQNLYLGNHWSFEKDSAIQFANMNLKNLKYYTLLISAYVNDSEVDWKRTIKTYFEFSYDIHSDNNENEIYVEDDYKIFNVKSEVLKNPK